MSALMSAIGGKADVQLDRENDANDPKRTHTVPCRSRQRASEFPVGEAAVLVPSEQSSGRGSVFKFRAVSSCPFTECNLGEMLGVALSPIDMSDDYQRKRFLGILVAVHPH